MLFRSFVGSQFLVGPPADHVLPAQLVNVAEAALGALPTTNDFFARLGAYTQMSPMLPGMALVASD